MLLLLFYNLLVIDTWHQDLCLSICTRSLGKFQLQQRIQQDRLCVLRCWPSRSKLISWVQHHDEGWVHSKMVQPLHQRHFGPIQLSACKFLTMLLQRLSWVWFLVLGCRGPTMELLQHQQLLKPNLLCVWIILYCVLCNVTESACCCFLHTWIEFFQTLDKCLQSSWIDNCHGQCWGVLCNTPKHECCSLLVETILLAQRTHQLWQNLIGDNCLGQVFWMFGQSTKC